MLIMPKRIRERRSSEATRLALEHWDECLIVRRRHAWYVPLAAGTAM